MSASAKRLTLWRKIKLLCPGQGSSRKEFVENVESMVTLPATVPKTVPTTTTIDSSPKTIPTATTGRVAPIIILPEQDLALQKYAIGVVRMAIIVKIAEPRRHVKGS